MELEKEFGDIFKDGWLLEKGKYKNGFETGVWKCFDKSGKIKDKISYGESKEK